MRQPDIHSRARPITRADARAGATCACDVNGSQIGSPRDCRIVPEEKPGDAISGSHMPAIWRSTSYRRLGLSTSSGPDSPGLKLIFSGPRIAPVGKHSAVAAPEGQSIFDARPPARLKRVQGVAPRLLPAGDLAGSKCVVQPRRSEEAPGGVASAWELRDDKAGLTSRCRPSAPVRVEVCERPRSQLYRRFGSEALEDWGRERLRRGRRAGHRANVKARRRGDGKPSSDLRSDRGHLERRARKLHAPDVDAMTYQRPSPSQQRVR